MSKQQFIFYGQSQRESCLLVISNLPLDGTMQVTIAPYVKPGSAAQRRGMWGVRLAEIAEQAWLDGRQYSPVIWHEHFKHKFLPDANEDGITLPGYQKWVELPGGELQMVGSTERLTTKGRAEYMDRVEAFCGVDLGVRFSEFQRKNEV